MLEIYLILMNALTFLLMLADKLLAQNKRWRIPEAVLMGTAILGGSLGGLLGMYLCRHKTRKPKFSVGLPLILVTQIMLLVLLYR